MVQFVLSLDVAVDAQLAKRQKRSFGVKRKVGFLLNSLPGQYNWFEIRDAFRSMKFGMEWNGIPFHVSFSQMEWNGN